MKKFIIPGLIAVMLAGVFLHAQGAIEIRAASSTAEAGWQRMAGPGGTAVWVAPTTSLTAADVAGVDARQERNGQPAVAMVFTAEGARKMAALTRAQLDRPIAILLDGAVIWAPIVRGTIDAEALLTGLTQAQAERLAASIKPQ